MPTKQGKERTHECSPRKTKEFSDPSKFYHQRSGCLGGRGAFPAGRESAACRGEPATQFFFVFMPCIHLRRDLRSTEGFAAALQSVRKLSPAPDFILTGGDM